MNDGFGKLFSSASVSDDENVEATETHEELTQDEVQQEAVETEAVEEPVTGQAEETDELSEAETGRKDISVPLHVLKEERQKRQALEALLKEREERDAEIEREREQQAAQSTKAQPAFGNFPDPIDDPQGYAAWTLEQVQQTAHAMVMQQKLDDAVVRASATHGEDYVREATEWALAKAETDLAFKQTAFAQPDPVEWAIQQHKQHAATSQFVADPNAWFEAELARRGLNMAAQQTTAAQSANTTMAARATPPKSLASVTSNTRATPTKGEFTFTSIFKK